MSKSQQHPSYTVCIERILSRSPVPLTVDALIEQVKSERPVGKAARSQVYNAINKLFQAVPVAPGRFGWLSTLLKGQTFRHKLSVDELQRSGALLLDELEHAVFFPQFFQSHEPDTRTIHLHLMGGPSLEVQASIVNDTWALNLGAPFQKWVDEVGGTARDSLVIYVEDANAGEYTMRLQPREAVREQDILRRNFALVKAAESIVSGDRKMRNAIPVWELAAMLIGRGFYADPVPPDDLHTVLRRSNRFQRIGDGYALLPASHSSQGRSSRGGGDWAMAGRTAALWMDFDGDYGSLEYLNGPDVLFDDESFIESDALDEFLFGEPGLDDQAMSTYFGVDGDVFGFSDEDADLFGNADSCEAYQMYLEEFEALSVEDIPLSHSDFHLLEAELEMLVGLEQEFGYLLPEQEARKRQLAERLFIDLDLFQGNDPDQSDRDEPPFSGF